MNIFWLSNDPEEIPKWMVDDHAKNGKMALEAAQLMTNCYSIEQLSHESCPRTINGNVRKYTHVNNPCAKWVKESADNFEWLLIHAQAILFEREFRCGKSHAILPFIRWCRDNKPDLPQRGLTPPAKNVKGYQKFDDPVLTYRNYYKLGKSHLHVWTRRKKPEWL